MTTSPGFHKSRCFLHILQFNVVKKKKMRLPPMHEMLVDFEDLHFKVYYCGYLEQHG